MENNITFLSQLLSYGLREVVGGFFIIRLIKLNRHGYTRLIVLVTLRNQDKLFMYTMHSIEPKRKENLKYIISPKSKSSILGV